MSRFNVKSILLGVGIGIVLMSIISMIYLAGMDPAKNLTEEEILKLAEKYDLVKRSDIINDSTAILSTSEENNTAENTTPGSESLSTNTATGKLDTEKPDKTIAKESETSAQVTITISEGATSEKIAAQLFEDGLIKDTSEFVKLLGDMGLEDNIQIGVFKINKNASMKEIAETITK